jgi:hypothetical protein
MTSLNNWKKSVPLLAWGADKSALMRNTPKAS